MSRNKQIRTALTEKKHCSQCTVGAVCCVQNNKQGLNYYVWRYETLHSEDAIFGRRYLVDSVEHLKESTAASVRCLQSTGQYVSSVHGQQPIRLYGATLNVII